MAFTSHQDNIKVNFTFKFNFAIQHDEVYIYFILLHFLCLCATEGMTFNSHKVKTFWFILLCYSAFIRILSILVRACSTPHKEKSMTQKNT